VGDLSGAIEAYRQALVREPGRAEAHQNLGVALLLAGDVFGARSHVREAIALLRAQGRSAEAEDLRHRAGAVMKLEDP
jgi:Flp pilus assembly protein TadD